VRFDAGSCRVLGEEGQKMLRVAGSVNCAVGSLKPVERLQSSTFPIRDTESRQWDRTGYEKAAESHLELARDLLYSHFDAHDSF